MSLLRSPFILDYDVKNVLFACWFFYMFGVMSGYLLREKGEPFNDFARGMHEPSC